MRQYVPATRQCRDAAFEQRIVLATRLVAWRVGGQDDAGMAGRRLGLAQHAQQGGVPPLCEPHVRVNLQRGTHDVANRGRLTVQPGARKAFLPGGHQT